MMETKKITQHCILHILTSIYMAMLKTWDMHWPIYVWNFIAINSSHWSVHQKSKKCKISNQRAWKNSCICYARYVVQLKSAQHLSLQQKSKTFQSLEISTESNSMERLSELTIHVVQIQSYIFSVTFSADCPTCYQVSIQMIWSWKLWMHIRERIVKWSTNFASNYYCKSDLSWHINRHQEK